MPSHPLDNPSIHCALQLTLTLLWIVFAVPSMLHELIYCVVSVNMDKDQFGFVSSSSLHCSYCVQWWGFTCTWYYVQTIGPMMKMFNNMTKNVALLAVQKNQMNGQMNKWAVFYHSRVFSSSFYLGLSWVCFTGATGWVPLIWLSAWNEWLWMLLCGTDRHVLVCLYEP